MLKRFMVLELFTYYCDALFYHNFKKCDISIVPNMSDDYNTLLDKLNKLKWAALFNFGNLHIKPTKFKYKYYPIDDLETIESLKNNK